MDILFFAKTFALTIAIVLVMQIEVGSRSLENHAMSWVQTSSITAPLHGVARGGSRLVRDVSSKVSNAIFDNVDKNKKEDSRLKRESSFRWFHSSKVKKTDDASSN